MPLFKFRQSPQEKTNIRTWISMTYFDVYAWIMFTHVQACLLEISKRQATESSSFVLTTQQIYDEDNKCALERLGR
jgi:hypothetical protein